MLSTVNRHFGGLKSRISEIPGVVLHVGDVEAAGSISAIAAGV